MKRQIVHSLLIIFMVLAGCSKKKDPTPSHEQLLSRTAGWRQTASVTGTTDLFSLYAPCEKDNILKFTQAGSTNGGTYVRDEGPTKCDSADPQTEDSGTWSFNNAKTTVAIVSQGITYSLTINTLTTTSLSFTYTVTDSGITLTVTDTYTGL